MAVLIVSYDLCAPGRNYDDLYDALREYEHCHEMESVWLLDTTDRCADVRDKLRQLMDANDKLLVARLHKKTWATANYACTLWLKDDARNW